LKGRRFRGVCLNCETVTELMTGPVFAGNVIMKHVREEHPEKEGFVAVIKEVTVS